MSGASPEKFHKIKFALSLENAAQCSEDSYGPNLTLCA